MVSTLRLHPGRVRYVRYQAPCHSFVHDGRSEPGDKANLKAHIHVYTCIVWYYNIVCVTSRSEIKGTTSTVISLE